MSDKERKKPTILSNTPSSIKNLRKSYKRRFDFPDLEKFYDEAMGESERSSVILMATFLDDALTFRISKHLCFKPNRQEYDQIFRFEGPLGTFSAKIEVATLFGFIDDKTYLQLDAIRELRNACAHSKGPTVFSDPIIANVAKRIFQPNGRITPGDEDSIKAAFVVETLICAFVLIHGDREEGFKLFFKLIREEAAEHSPSHDKPPKQ